MPNDTMNEPVTRLNAERERISQQHFATCDDTKKGEKTFLMTYSLIDILQCFDLSFRNLCYGIRSSQKCAKLRCMKKKRSVNIGNKRIATASESIGPDFLDFRVFHSDIGGWRRLICEQVLVSNR